jgi:hypothetical protein
MLALSACTDLGAVRDWAGTSLQAAQFTEVVETYADTPNRLARYDEVRAARWRELSAERDAQAKALKLQLGLVADYMATLAALADNGTASYGEDISTLTKSLQETGQLDSALVEAAGGIAGALENAALGFWQKREVGRLIAAANPHLQKLLAGNLRDIVDRDFRRDLTIEGQLFELYFEDLLDAGGGSATANAALREWADLRAAENARRMAAVDAYVQVLDEIAAGHQALFDHRNDLDAKALARDLADSAQDLRDGVRVLIRGG